jgi:hypothetical protein
MWSIFDSVGFVVPLDQVKHLSWRCKTLTSSSLITTLKLLISHQFTRSVLLSLAL